jgi:drug/metabolite transporter (DMT)-like permease
VSSGLTAVFIASAPLMLALFSGMFGQWPTRREWLGIAIGFSGVALLASGNDFSAHPMGVIAVLGAVACWSLGSVLAQHKMILAPGPMGFASEMLVGGFSLLIIALLRGESFVIHPTATALYAWGYLVIAGSLAAFSAYMYLLSRVSSALASSYAYVNPVIAVVLGATFAAESIGTREIVAMLIILGSVVVLTTTKKSRPADSTLVMAGETS